MLEAEGVQLSDLTYIHREITTTVSLVNIHHLVEIKKKKEEEKCFYPRDENP